MNPLSLSSSPHIFICIHYRDGEHVSISIVVIVIIIVVIIVIIVIVRSIDDIDYRTRSEDRETHEIQQIETKEMESNKIRL